MDKYTITLSQSSDTSFITLLKNNKQQATIPYFQKTHKYRSDSDFKSLSTEFNTYGDKAMIELFNYFLTTRL